MNNFNKNINMKIKNLIMILTLASVTISCAESTKQETKTNDELCKN